MLNLIQRFFSREKYNRGELRHKFAQYFFSLPEHVWLTPDIKLHFEKLFSLLPSSLLEALMTKYPLTFVPSEEMKKAPLGLVRSNTVVVFPEFQKLLHSKKGCAVAYLAHELALVLYELEENKDNTLLAEIEADKFVADIGLTFELEELLLMLDETIEKRLRLTYLTINHFSDKDN